MNEPQERGVQAVREVKVWVFWSYYLSKFGGRCCFEYAPMQTYPSSHPHPPSSIVHICIHTYSLAFHPYPWHLHLLII